MRFEAHIWPPNSTKITDWVEEHPLIKDFMYIEKTDLFRLVDGLE